MLEAKYSRNTDDRLPGESAAPDDDVADWAAPTHTTPIASTVSIPGSKSLTTRELVVSALADSPSRIRAALDSRDSQLMTDALKALGTSVLREGDDLIVTPADELLGSTTIACGLAGTVMRFVPAVAGLALGPTAFDGDVYARERPMRSILDALRALGVDIADEGRGALPFTVHGTGSVRGGRVELDASGSSQFVSGLLLSAARFEEGVHVVHTGASLPSLPHIEMTLDVLRARGVKASSPTPGQWIVEPGPIAGRDLTIEPDLSNAAPFLAAALVTGGSVTIPLWPASTTQVGDQLREILPQFGAEVAYAPTGDGVGDLTVTGTGRIKPVTLHLPEAGELAPNLIGLAALADGVSEFTGIGHIRGHETDRISALATELTKVGCEVEEREDGLRIVPPTDPQPSVWLSYADHRMATTGAIVGLRLPGIEINDVESTSKTMPEFTEMWQDMLR
ncbi:3-phosphoshikimate 1-carboxyvinyltransferase [Leucobacter sp. UCMA 4100]|uniref:3-phosphoshikimate 1-carboxyvinyltransferase n=1 Tax=Leucobacter sp. UCMA 4100 TaxID=2810534 RepID=UPI0022EB5458|nr:3-phosphoshikimate 1-carboxyvinyltransferase [Leucobacter sp. UCMA 4100]MDA3146093.1 3-phosphoshikimate 1-carboxyvinyltransferase [Leucobacter sp. UCMA 4100]